MGTSSEVQHRAEELDCACTIPDLITPEEKQRFLEIFAWLWDNYIFKAQNKTHGVRGTEGEYILYNILVSDAWQGWRSEDRQFALKISQRYNFNPSLPNAQLLYLPAGYEGVRHWDKHPQRRCVLSIPLSGGSTQPVNFFENETSPEPLVSLCYQTPTLLNVEQKWHSVSKSDEARILLQIPFGNIYQDAKKELLARCG